MADRDAHSSRISTPAKVGVILAIALVVWLVGPVLLFLFGAVLFAVGLDGAAMWLVRRTGLPQPAALAIVLASILAVGGVLVWSTGPRLVADLTAVGDTITTTVDELEAWAEQNPWGRRALERVEGGGLTPEDPAGIITRWLSTLLTYASHIAISLLVAIYLAIHPTRHRDAVLHLVPRERRDRFGDIASALGHAMRRWLIGRMSSMAVVGVLTAVGLWIIGIPSALALGVIAAVLSFVPYIGPLLSLVPMLLVAMPQGTWAVFGVLGVYAASQTLETAIITPLIEKRAVYLPPAFTLSFQLLMGVVAGALGFVMATPVAVVLVVLVQMLYVEDKLDDSVTVLGQ